MTIKGEITIESNLFAELSKRFAKEVQDAIVAFVLHLEGLIKRNIVEIDAIQTGFMLNSVYISSGGKSTYPAAEAAANKAGVGRDQVLPETKPGENETIIGMAAEYAAIIEFGAQYKSGAYRPARPFFVPAVEEARQTLDKLLAEIGARSKP